MEEFLTPLSLLIPAFSLVAAPAVLTLDLHRKTTTLPYHEDSTSSSAASVQVLSPDTLSAPVHSTSELLRTLSRVAASKPTSWLSGHTDILAHLDLTWGP